MPVRARQQPVLRLLAALLALSALAAGVEAAPGAAVLPTLYVNYVGSNCTFTLVNDSGGNVGSIAPGTYQLTLSATDFESCGPDQLPDFDLAGPGVSVQTPIDNGTGAAADYTVTFQPSSTYVAQDLNQPLSKITFTTQASGSPPPVTVPANPATKTVTTTASSDLIGSRTSSAAAAAFRGTLSGTVTAAGKTTLTYKGKPVTQLAAGRYTLLVADHSSRGGFLLQEPPRIATTVTAVAFIGTRKLTLDLTAGQALFYSTFIAAKNYFIVVAAH